MATVRKSDYYITKIPTLDKLTNVVVDNLFGSDRSSRGPSVCLSGTSLSAGRSLTRQCLLIRDLSFVTMFIHFNKDDL